MKYIFWIDTAHLQHPYDEEDLDLPVELTDEQFERICQTMARLIESNEYHSMHPHTDDDEWWLYKYLPDIHQHIEETVREWAPKVWDEGILPQLFNVDMYVPEEVWDKLREDGVVESDITI